jgi:hypothetical protein
LHKQDFSYKPVKPDYWETVGKSNGIYIGDQDVDDLESFLHFKKGFDKRKSSRKLVLKRMKTKLFSMNSMKIKNTKSKLFKERYHLQ